MRAKKLLFVFLTLLLVVGGCVLLYATFGVGYRTYRLYQLVKTRSLHGWEGMINQSDPVLGYRPSPLASGFEVLPDGKNVMKLAFDQNGCRLMPPTLVTQMDPGAVPSLLFVGCSFTYGAACPSDQIFPYLTAQELGAESVNAGVVSYGYAQMILRARELVPLLRPNFVVFQCSPWLILRGVSRFRPTTYGNIPTPYLSVDEKGYAIAPPVYRSPIFDLPITYYQRSERNIADFAGFFARVGLPFYVYSDIHLFFLKVRSLCGLVPRPAVGEDVPSLERYVYTQMYQLCRENNAVLVLVSLWFKESAPPDKFPSGDLPGVIFVDADKELLSELKNTPGRRFDDVYKHLSGDPPRLVDEHPSPAAHRIIARAIARSIREWITHTYRAQR